MEQVVVIAHGPRSVTRDAVERARRFGAPVRVVAADHHRERDARVVRTSRVRPTRAAGRAGLEEALADLADDAVVLLLHDDVLLAAECAAALADAAASGAEVAVPATNEPDADGYVGELPPDVAQPLGDAAPARTSRFRPSCLAAPVGVLRGLTWLRLTAPSTRIDLGDGEAALLPAVVATHLDTCRDRTAPPVSPDDRPLLVAAMIVRDEEENLGPALASLDGVVDRVVVVDTGSRDGTVAVASAHGAQVLEREWRDDFAWARNEGLAACDDAWWVLQLDADERLEVEDVDHLRGWLATAIAEPGAFALRYRAVDGTGAVVDEDHLPRLFPGGSRYVGRIHEVAHAPDGTELRWLHLDLATVRHEGYAADRGADGERAVRNARIARAAHEEAAGPREAFQLARSLLLGREPDDLGDEARRLLEQVADAVRDGDADLNARAVGQTFGLLAGDALRRDDPATAWSLAREALVHAPHDLGALHAHARAGVAAGAFADVLAHADDEPTGHLDASTALARGLELTKAHLGQEDVPAAGRRLLAALEPPVPPGFTGWTDLVALVGITAPERAEELLREPLVTTRAAEAVEAVTATFHPEDAVELLTEVALEAHERGLDATHLAGGALATAVVVGRVDLVRRLLDVPDLVPPAHVARLRTRARATGRTDVAAALAER